MDGDSSTAQRLAHLAVERRDGMTPLHYAALSRVRGSKCIDVLLQARADVAAINNEGSQAVHLAAENPNEEALCALLAGRADVDAKTLALRTPLHFAAVEGILQSCQVLLAAGATVNAMNSCGAIPLHWAAKTGKRDVCMLLVDAKSDLNVVDNLGRTAAGMASDNLHVELANILSIPRTH